MLDNEHWREECGIIGILNQDQAAHHIYLGLYALQHRGQEAYGIVTFDQEEQGIEVKECKDFGTVSKKVTQDDLEKMTGKIGIGHVRYSTQGGKLQQNIQPFIFNSSSHGAIAIAHNGNLTNAKILKDQLEKSGSIFTSTSDSEVLMHLLAKSKKNLLREKIFDVMQQVRGAYALVLLAKDQLYGIRDPFGFRPLALGKKQDSWVLASESCAFDLLGMEFVRELQPGEVVRICDGKSESFFPLSSPEKSALCSFEPIYFSRPDSLSKNEFIYQTRKKMGANLAKEAHIEADVVIAVPDSGVPMALGYAQESNIPFEIGLVRNHYVGRTFIQPYQSSRDFDVKLKLNPIPLVLKGKKVVVIDDSIVRGTTCSKIVCMLREAGAAEIHFRVASPPITHSCFYGVSTPDRSKLLAAQKNRDEICEQLGADTLAYLSMDGLKDALGANSTQTHCFACFDGKYPEPIFQKIPPQASDLKPFY